MLQIKEVYKYHLLSHVFLFHYTDISALILTTFSLTMSVEKAEPIAAAAESLDLKTIEHTHSKDNALIFLEEHEGTTTQADPHELPRLRRKVDYMVIPFLMFCYTLNFIDKVLLNVSLPVNLYLQIIADTTCSMPPSWDSTSRCT